MKRIAVAVTLVALAASGCGVSELPTASLPPQESSMPAPTRTDRPPFQEPVIAGLQTATFALG